MSEEKAKLEMTTAESQVKYYGVRLYTREELESACKAAIKDYQFQVGRTGKQFHNKEIVIHEITKTVREETIADFLAECEKEKFADNYWKKEVVSFEAIRQIAKKMRGEGKGGD